MGVSGSESFLDFVTEEHYCNKICLNLVVTLIVILLLEFIVVTYMLPAEKKERGRESFRSGGVGENLCRR